MAEYGPMMGKFGTYDEQITGAKMYGPGMIGAATSGKLGSAGYNERERKNDRKKKAMNRQAIQQRGAFGPNLGGQ